MRIPADGAVGRLLGVSMHPFVLKRWDGICVVVTIQAVACAFLVTDGSAGCGNFHVCNDPVVLSHRNDLLLNENFAAVFAVRALCQAGFGAGSFDLSVHNRLMLLLGVKAQVAAGACGSLALAGEDAVPVVSQRGNDFLRNPEFVALFALPAGGHAVFRTGSGDFLADRNAEMLLTNYNKVLRLTQRTGILHIRSRVTAVDHVRLALVPNVTLGIDGDNLCVGVSADFGLCLGGGLAFNRFVLDRFALDSLVHNSFAFNSFFLDHFISRLYKLFVDTGEGHNALGLASGRSCHNAFVVRMSVRINGKNYFLQQQLSFGKLARFIGSEIDIAVGAVEVSDVARLLTGGIFRFHIDRFMADGFQRSDIFFGNQRLNVSIQFSPNRFIGYNNIRLAVISTDKRAGTVLGAGSGYSLFCILGIGVADGFQRSDIFCGNQLLNVFIQLSPNRFDSYNNVRCAIVRADKCAGAILSAGSRYS